MKQKAKQIQIQEKEDEEETEQEQKEEINDIYDAIQSFTNPYVTSKEVTRAHIISKPTEKEKDYIIRQTLLAKTIRHSIKSDKWAKKTEQLIMLDTHLRLSFARNRRENPIMEGFLGEWKKARGEESKQNGIKEVLGNLMKPEDEEKEHDED